MFYDLLQRARDVFGSCRKCLTPKLDIIVISPSTEYSEKFIMPEFGKLIRKDDVWVTQRQELEWWRVRLHVYTEQPKVKQYSSGTIVILPCEERNTLRQYIDPKLCDERTILLVVFPEEQDDLSYPKVLTKEYAIHPNESIIPYIKKLCRLHFQ